MALPSIGPSGKPRITSLGEPILGCSCDCVTECDCTNAETATVGSWDNTAENPCGIVSCICKMIWLIEFQLSWRDPDGEHLCRFVDGAFILTNTNTLSSGCSRSYGPFTGPPYTFPPESGGNPVECCPDTYRPSPFNVPGVCALNCPWLNVSVTCALNESDEPVVYWAAILYDEFRGDVCVLERWWAAEGAGDLISTVSPGQTFTLYDDASFAGVTALAVDSCTITLLGPVCDGDFDGDGTPDDDPSRCPLPCGALLDFTFDQIGRSCSYNIINSTVAAGTCNIKWYIWSDGYKSEDPERPVWNTGGACGTTEGPQLTLWIVMENDCVYSRTKTAPDCCNCNNQFNADPCFEPSGSLSITQNPEDPCEYTLCASTANLDDGSCGSGDSFIEYQLDGGGCMFNDDCDCEEDLVDCLGSGCGKGLMNGECDTLTLTETRQLRWRVWDGICGCPSPWTYETLICNPCECCETANDGVLSALDITVTNIVGGSSGDCADCDKFNDTYHVPTTATCYGNDTFNQPTACIEGVDHDQIQIDWQITCTDTTTTLTINVQTGLTFPAFATFEKVITHASGVIIDCSEFAGTIDRIYCSCSGSALVKCDAEDIAVSVALTFI